MIDHELRLRFMANFGQEMWDFSTKYAEAIHWGLDEIERLRSAIRIHRDEHGDDRCWLDDYRLYEALKEPIPAHACRLDEPGVMRANCERFIASRHDPSKTYLSPQREIERLRSALRSIANLKDGAFGEHGRFDTGVTTGTIACGIATLALLPAEEDR